MMRVPPSSGFLVPPESGHVNSVRMLVKVTEGQSRGALFIYERSLQPGEVVARHVHVSDDECAYILSGEVRFVVGAESFVAAAGSYVVKPRGVAHECVNEGRAPAGLIEIAVPGRIEGYYRELAAIRNAAGEGSAAQQTAVDALASRYGIALLGAPQSL